MVVKCTEIHTENAMMKTSTHFAFPQRAAGWCEAVGALMPNSFRSGLAEMKVGEDGKGPIQPADLLGSREAPVGGKLRWYHRNFLVLCFL